MTSKLLTSEERAALLSVTAQSTQTSGDSKEEVFFDEGSTEGSDGQVTDFPTVDDQSDESLTEHTDATADTTPADELLSRIRAYVEMKRKESLQMSMLLDAEKVFKELADFLSNESQPALVYASDKCRVTMRARNGDETNQKKKFVETYLPFTMALFDFVLERIPELEKLPLPKGYDDNHYRYVAFSQE